MIARYYLIYLFILLYSCVKAQFVQQNHRINIKINKDLQTLYDDERKILSNWEKYLNTIETVYYHSPDTWSVVEKEKYWFPDIEVIYLASATKMFREYSPVLLNIQRKDSIYILKTAFINSEKDIHSIFNVIVRENNEGEYIFSRYQDYYTQDWETIQIESITFFCKDRTKFNYPEAKKSANLSDSLANLFNTQTFQSRYYIFQSTEERLRAKGYDYTYLMYNTIQESADNDINNRIINSGEGAEYDPHEIVHTYLNQVYWNTLHNFVNEGIATFIGGNIEKSKERELSNLKKYLDLHKDLDLNNVTSVKKASEGKTNIMYALSAFLCKKVYEKEGIEGLKKLCLAGSLDSDVYRVIEEILGVRQTELNQYLREEIKKAHY
ncbi:hypothetical protein CLV98_1314 [Dyadobacter jejuensis]|uniref:Uncharacterized protein n=1 Tax=Dyadobacter jejuensis TaxID=1082580 RepID=A0A316A796_9BACT|nr:hypothetical protein [Dyadobacter jejuensis]PWJ52850.1 hypothetical protein CLV98_1314 [Dyadobacter jejuensis]